MLEAWCLRCKNTTKTRQPKHQPSRTGAGLFNDVFLFPSPLWRRERRKKCFLTGRTMATLWPSKNSKMGHTAESCGKSFSTSGGRFSLTSRQGECYCGPNFSACKKDGRPSEPPVIQTGRKNGLSAEFCRKAICSSPTPFPAFGLGRDFYFPKSTTNKFNQYKNISSIHLARQTCWPGWI